jgi:predicted nucleic acid-binding protein
MNGSNLFVDTNICIYLLNNDHIVADLLDGYPMYISFITEIELYACYSSNPLAKQILDEFIEAVNVVNINSHIKQKQLRLGATTNLNYPTALLPHLRLSRISLLLLSIKGLGNYLN